MGIPKIATAEFSLSVHQEDRLPRESLPEVAFLGRSNVGKSSLINTLLGRRNLVRTSATPGCTRALNFFLTRACRPSSCSRSRRAWSGALFPTRPLPR